MSLLTDVRESRDLVVNLTLRELRGKYKRSVLGWSWSLLNPLANMAIYSLVFGVLLAIDPPVGEPSGLHNFPAFLLCGLLAWNFFSGSVNGSMMALLGNAGIIKKVYFPRQILVYSTILALDTTFLLELAVLAAFLLIIGNMVLPWLPIALLLVVLVTVFSMGVGLMVSVLNVYFRDMQYLVNIGLQVWFYLTPIVYPLSVVEDRQSKEILGVSILTLYKLNPMVGFVEAFRSVLYDLRFPQWGTLAYITVWAFGILVAGIFVFRRFEGRLAEEL
jgi:ABC-type polysaccharide/polyol phosphate export permease